MSVRRPTVRLSTEARQDISDIGLFTREAWGVRQNKRYRATLVERLQLLHDFPQLGLSRDDLLPGCRAVPVEQHVIYYFQPRPTEIVVLRILHRRQDPAGQVDVSGS